MVSKKKRRGGNGNGSEKENDEGEVAEYEQAREQRIKENLQRMHQLGILELSRTLKPPPKPKTIYPRKPAIPVSGSPRRSSRMIPHRKKRMVIPDALNSMSDQTESSKSEGSEEGSEAGSEAESEEGSEDGNEEESEAESEEESEGSQPSHMEASQGSQPNNIEGVQGSQRIEQRRKRSVTLMAKHRKTKDLHIEFDADGGAIGENYYKFRSWVGVTTRTMIPVTEPAWNLIDKVEMDLLWSTIKHHWNIEEDIYRVPVLNIAHYSWKSFKKRLIANFLKKDRNPCAAYPYLYPDTWEKFCAMKTTKEFLEKSEKGRKNAMLNTNPSRLGGRPYRVMVPKWKKQMSKPGQSSKLGNLKDERAQNFLLARTVKAPDGTLVLPAHLQELADEIIEKDRQISQGLWVPGPGVDVLIAVLGSEHGGRTMGVGHTVGLKKGIPGILKKKRKSRTPVDTEWEEQRMTFNAECEEKRKLFEVECAEERRLFAEERRLFEVECEEKRKSWDVQVAESRRQLNDEFEEKRKLFDAHFQMCMQQMPKLDGNSGTRKSSTELVPCFDELDVSKASKTIPISKPVAALPSTQLVPTKSSQQGERKKKHPKEISCASR